MKVNRLVIFGMFFFSTLIVKSQSFELSEQKFNGVVLTAGNAADFNNDGFLDIIYAGKEKDFSIKTHLHLNINGNFQSIDTQIPGVQRGSITPFDFNNDGLIDIILSGRDSNQEVITQLYLNVTVNQNEVLFEKSTIALTGVFDSDISASDFNNDGWTDIALSGETGEGNFTAIIYKNISGKSFEELTSVNLPGTRLGTIDWLDYDNDGDQDILQTGQTENVAFANNIWENVGNDRFIDVHQFNGLMFTGASYGDFDNDGDLDLFISGETMTAGFQSQLFLKEGNKYTQLEGEFLNTMNGSINIGDINNDDQLDILATGVSDQNQFTSVIYRQSKNMLETINNQLPGVGLRSNGLLIDIDNDTDLDSFILGGQKGIVPTAHLYINQQNVSNKPNAPIDLSYSITGDQLNIKWRRATEDSHKNLNFNVSIIDTETDEILVNSYSLNNGVRKIQDWGNAGKNNFFYFNLADLIYDGKDREFTVTVQAISANKSSSSFSQELHIEVRGILTSSENQFDDLLYSIYPNPIIDLLNIQGLDHQMNFLVMDLSGKEILNTTLNPNKMAINMGFLKNGVYILKLSDSEGVQFSTRFIKL